MNNKVFPDRKCIVCDKLFTPILKTNTICPNADCKEKHRKKYKSEYDASIKRKGFDDRECEVCKVLFTPIVANQKLCQSVECKKENSRRLGKLYRQKYRKKGDRKTSIQVCLMCNKEFQRTNNQTVCYAKKCRDTYKKQEYENAKTRKRMARRYGKQKECKVCYTIFYGYTDFCKQECADKWDTAKRGFGILLKYGELEGY